MRILLTLFLLAPVLLQAQINRSATEVAREVTKEWLVRKLFAGKQYQPVYFSELKAYEDKKTGAAWTIEHRFSISNDKGGFETPADSRVTYSFLFFLDKRMKVVKAESYSKKDDQ